MSGYAGRSRFGTLMPCNCVPRDVDIYLMLDTILTLELKSGDAHVPKISAASLYLARRGRVTGTSNL